METYYSQLLEGLSAWHPLWTYGFLLLSAFLENVLPPVPGDTVVIFSAYLAGRGVLGWLPVYVATCAGGTAGFAVMFWVGRVHGRALLTGSRWRLFPPERVARAQAWLSRYGAWLILANRFLSGVRSVIALGAGIGGADWKIVLVLALASMLLWNGLLLYAGLLVGQNWEAVISLLQQYNRVALVAVLVAAGALLLRWRRHSRG